MQERAPERRTSQTRYLTIVATVVGLFAIALAITRLLYWMIAI
jgi:hypothetical protein